MRRSHKRSMSQSCHRQHEMTPISPETGLLYVALQGVLGHAEFCVDMDILKSASHHAICKDCHLNERLQPDCNGYEDKMPSRHVFSDYINSSSEKLPLINFHRKNLRKAIAD